MARTREAKGKWPVSTTTWPAPSPPVVPGPKGGSKGKLKATGDATSGVATMATVPDTSAAEGQLTALIAALGPHHDTLPESVRSMIQAHQESSASAQAKALHRQVSTQANAARALSALQSRRTQYLQAWEDYLTQLGETLQKQMAEKEETVKSMNAEENALQDTIDQARATFLSIAGKELPADMELEEASVNVFAEASDRTKEKEETLTAAVQSMRADAAKARRREGSRTPRRAVRSEEAESISSGEDPKPPFP